MTQIETLTIDDFNNYDWQSVIEDTEVKLCSRYQPLFVKKSRECAESDDEIGRDVYIIFAVLTSMRLVLDLPEKPFAVLYEYAGMQPITPDRFPNNVWNALSKLLPNIVDPEMQARVGDMLWSSGNGKYTHAQTAVSAYLKSAENLKEGEFRYYYFDRVERAFQLAKRLGSNPDKNPNLKKVLDYMETEIDSANINDDLICLFMQILSNASLGDSKKYVELSKKGAEYFEAKNNWFHAKSFWILNAKWNRLANNQEGLIQAEINIGETHVSQAEDLISQGKEQYSRASHELMQAVEALRMSQAPASRIKQVHHRLIEIQKENDNFQRISFSMDVSPMVQQAQSSVTELNKVDAILKLASMYNPASENNTRNEIEKQIRDNPLRFWISSIQLDMSNRVSGRREGLSEEDEQREATIKAEMHRYASMVHHRLWADAVVRPALGQIHIEHKLRVEDFIQIVLNNPFVPPGYERIFALGLWYGFIGEFMIAAHLLVPQVENSIRYILENYKGEIGTKLDSQGIQDTYDLGKLLYQIPQVKEIFGSDILFDLQTVLVSRFGINLRNNLAHGKLPANAYYSSEVIYFWWIILYLCCYPLLMPDTEDIEMDE